MRQFRAALARQHLLEAIAVLEASQLAGSRQGEWAQASATRTSAGSSAMQRRGHRPCRSPRLLAASGRIATRRGITARDQQLQQRVARAARPARGTAARCAV